MIKTPILQFGTSRFLQAHVDLFVSEALKKSEAAGPITVVQTSGDPARARRLKALALPAGFPVRVEGLRDGKPETYSKQITSVCRTLSTATDWAAVVRAAVEEAEFIISNTGDKGFLPNDSDDAPDFVQAMSYPAKLTQLLLARFRVNAKPLQVMPTELIAGNGDALRCRTLELAAAFGDDFVGYLQTDVVWVNSLVDRIVSKPLEPAGAVAEPYALWAIEDQPGLKLPCRHAAIKVVADLGAIEALKLYILNLGHSYLADRWLKAGSPEGATVREAMASPETRGRLEALYRDEVLPGFAAAGMGGEAGTYLAATLDRFANPYLEHRLSDIAQNHDAKIERRIAAFVNWARKSGDKGDKPVLTALMEAPAVVGQDA
ncbi:mannitol dehydrogenase family protein [Pelagibius litoralis]|uniref:Mannitol dehydrogenase family protein n=1 Tax=Pelagibius litoralis TaxID=374515 RepID=A0A967K8Q5_9PROT|nr:mannitol dehydrogenase family protein [Pelagibius litoralis]NIA70588.1 mannitol dehydrogenase family protein [Pelagibius litoralis]